MNRGFGSAYLQSMDYQREPQSKHPTGENPGIYTVDPSTVVLQSMDCQREP